MSEPTPAFRVDPTTAPANPVAAALASDPSVKQIRDFAFAVVLMESGRLGERQLIRATRDWSPQGQRTLAEQLAHQGLLSAEECIGLEAKATSYLNESDPAMQSDSPTDPGVTTAWTGPAGDQMSRLGRLLGIFHPAHADAAEEGRQVTTRFTLLRKLGQGGIGAVWLARDENLRRNVAIKELIVRSGVSDAVARRFQREAEITGQLEHPNIVSIYQFGEDAESGRAFYAMRFVGKKTLADAVKEYHEKCAAGMDVTLDLHRLLSAFLTVCQAIGYAHSSGVIHRDLKPDNIALDNFGQVIVIDWGLAKMLEDGDQHEGIADASGGTRDGAERTVAGHVLGTPLYMAPEQAAGRLDEVDERTDIYGLGAILFAILTGFAPHEKSHSSLSTATKVSEFLNSIASAPTPRVSDHIATVDPGLAAICEKAMSNRRYVRYESAGQLAEDVQRWMAGEPVSAHSEPLSRRINRWIAHHRRWSQVIAIAFIAVLVAGISLGFMARQKQIAEQHDQFHDMLAHARQMETQLGGAARSLGRNVRFMTNVPGIQGIISARGGNGENEADDVWRERIERVYQGLLRANPEYLSVSYIQVEGKNKSKEIARVARQSGDADQIFVVPKSRLAVFEEETLIHDVANLQPGEVKLSHKPLVRKGVVSRRHGLALVAGAPVYNEKNGVSQGAVVIKMSLADVIRQIARGLRKGPYEIFVTDTQGSVLMRQQRDSQMERESGKLDLCTILPDLRDFFADAGDQHFLSDGHTYVALRVRLDPDDHHTVVGIVFRLSLDR
ncbi:MAG: serine/threonine protein kinase [Planctomycetes bacterium]|nr:serine/threonine protein kinase [Planctomycetota bacterium]